MIFTSISFLIFFAVTFLVYCICPSRIRWLWLLLTSYLFFALQGFIYLILVLALVSGLSFFFANLIKRATTDLSKKMWFIGSLILILSLLIWLKYLPFLTDTINTLFVKIFGHQIFQSSRKLASIGVSFFVFQAISYMIDIYLDQLQPINNIGIHMLALSFFPKILQGPIEREGNIIPQFQELEKPNSQGIKNGLKQFIWGAFKKIVIANQLVSFVDPIFNHPLVYSGLPIMLSTYVFSFQIYFDFSGYTDMALGLAKFFNIRLSPNFNTPYLARSVPDFWRRWHISFSSWILDYIFKPLQFRFRDYNKYGTPLALFITFVISGIWHGASWCFIAWGTIHGLFLSASMLTSKRRTGIYRRLGIDKTKMQKYIQRLITFNLISFSWLFFRANNIGEAFYMVKKSIIGLPESIRSITGWSRIFADWNLLIAGILVVFVVISESADRKFSRENHCSDEKLSWIVKLPIWARSSVYGAMLYLLVFFGVGTQSFIYMQY